MPILINLVGPGLIASAHIVEVRRRKTVVDSSPSIVDRGLSPPLLSTVYLRMSLGWSKQISWYLWSLD